MWQEVVNFDKYRKGYELYLFCLPNGLMDDLICLWCSDLELKPQGQLTVTVVRANDLKNMEMIGKSDPYVVLYIRPLFKVKTKVIENNLNPVWNQTYNLIAEDKETQSIIIEVLLLFMFFFYIFYLSFPSNVELQSAVLFLKCQSPAHDLLFFFYYY